MRCLEKTLLAIVRRTLSRRRAVRPSLRSAWSVCARLCTTKEEGEIEMERQRHAHGQRKTQIEIDIRRAQNEIDIRRVRKADSMLGCAFAIASVSLGVCVCHCLCVFFKSLCVSASDALMLSFYSVLLFLQSSPPRSLSCSLPFLCIRIIHSKRRIRFCPAT